MPPEQGVIVTFYDNPPVFSCENTIFEVHKETRRRVWEWQVEEFGIEEETLEGWFEVANLFVSEEDFSDVTCAEYTQMHVKINNALSGSWQFSFDFQTGVGPIGTLVVGPLGFDATAEEIEAAAALAFEETGIASYQGQGSRLNDRQEVIDLIPPTRKGAEGEIAGEGEGKTEGFNSYLPLGWIKVVKNGPSDWSIRIFLEGGTEPVSETFETFQAQDVGLIFDTVTVYDETSYPVLLTQGAPPLPASSASAGRQESGRLRSPHHVNGSLRNVP